MDKERPTFDLDDFQTDDKKSIEEVSKEQGFTSRQSMPMVLDRASRFVEQHGVRLKPGGKLFVKRVGVQLNLYQNELFEEALIALLEKRGLTAYLDEYNNKIK